MSQRDELAAARDLPDGPAKASDLERIAADADAAGDVRLGFDARCALMEVHHGLQRWRMVEPFRWCRWTADQYAEAFGPADEAALRLHHRRAVLAAYGSPRIGLAQTVELLDDLDRRWPGSRTVHRLRCQLADHLGDEPAARQWLARWQAAEPDGDADCAGCEPAWHAELLAGWGEWAPAVRAVEPVLAGRVRCPAQPERALAAVMVACLQLDRPADAARAHVRAYQRHRTEWDAFPLLAEHLRFCALTGHYERGLQILGAHLGRLDFPYDEGSAMRFAASGAQVCRLAAAAGAATGFVHRPEYGERRAADLTVEALGRELVAQAEDLAGRFDARSGTAHQSGLVAARLRERPIAAPPPLLPDDELGEGSLEPV
jgi:hypothetical protein